MAKKSSPKQASKKSTPTAAKITVKDSKIVPQSPRPSGSGSPSPTPRWASASTTAFTIAGGLG